MKHAALAPIHLAHLTIKNRIVRSATNDYTENPDGCISAEQLSIWEEQAANEVGLFITGHLYINVQGQASPTQNAIDADQYIPALKQGADIVHRYGGKIVAQINHAGAKAISDDPAGPVPLEMIPGRQARAMTVDEIHQAVADFAQAALRVKQAGCDGVQVHIAHLYLLSQFTTPSINTRTDAYGGSSENRFRIVEETIQAIRQVCGADYPIFIKINSNDPEKDDEYESELLYMLKRFEALGMEAVELSGYDFGQRKEHNFYLERAARLKKQVQVPLILVGGIRDLSDMDAVLSSGIDMVSLCRPFICESDIITRLLNGQPKSRCINCGGCQGLPRPYGPRCVFHRKTSDK